MLSALIFLLLQINLLIFLAQSTCLENGNYTPNSTYSNNLNSILSSIPNNIGTNGFYNASAGSNPDRANAIALCKGDLQLDACRACIGNLTADLRTECPNQRQAVSWTDKCMLRYSNETLLRTLATSPTLYNSNQQNATSPDQFMADVMSILNNLRARAARGGPIWKLAARIRNETVTESNDQQIYAMVQCTPDLSPEDCNSCLVDAAAAIPICCNRRIGARVNFPSCSLYYEVFRFYNESRIQELAAGSDESLPSPELPLAPEPPPLQPRTHDHGNNRTRTVIVIVVAIVACVILVVSVCILLRRRMKRKTEEIQEAVDGINTAESIKYALNIIRAATNDFSDDNKLGQGGFGPDYKGKLPNGKEIAVKRLSQDSRQGDQEFKNEVLLLANLRHRNLVRLLGFCLQGMEKLLIYEFVQNSSLDKFIFDPIKRSYLDWEKIKRIIGGIARGILYLHEDSQLRIIHRDLKPSNILLDEEMNSKIADFGTARLFERDETQGNTSRIAGTFGYMAPEYALHGQFSVKSDVFSFGVIVLEIISGQKTNGTRCGENVEDLLSSAWRNWSRRTIAEIVDPGLRSGSGSISDMVRCIHIGLLCVQENAADRPTMASVVLMLSSYSSTLAAPSEPAFYMPIDDNVSDTSYFTTSAGEFRRN